MASICGSIEFPDDASVKASSLSPEKRRAFLRSQESVSGASSCSPEKRPGTGRFNPEELTCFRRLPTPSAQIARKAEHYWQSAGSMRRVMSESGPLWRAFHDESGDLETSSRSAAGSSASRPYTPLEEKTAIVLDQIFPRSALPDNTEREPSRQNPDSERVAGSSAARSTTSSSPTKSRRPALAHVNVHSRQERLLHLRQKLFERFSTMKAAFDTFTNDSSGYTKELTRKQFLHFLGKHFAALGREEHDRIFELMDAGKSGTISLSELHIAVEAAAPVRNLEDLRRRWIALGFTSMRQAIAAMDGDSAKPAMGKRLHFTEFVASLCRVGIVDDEEHQALFALLTNASGSTTVTLDELASGLASVSPSLLLEELRERLLKRYGSLNQAYRSLDLDDNFQLSCSEFMQHVATHFKLSAHDAAKAFHLIDIDDSNWISHAEFIVALRLSEPGLFLEEVRRKVRQRYRSIRQALVMDEQEDPFQRVSADGLHMEAKTVTPLSLSEFCSALSAVQLSEADTQTLFELIDVKGNGKLTPNEFVRGLRLFAPSCVMEDLRLRCLASYADAREAFQEVVREHSGFRRDAALLDQKQLRRILEDLDLASGINVEALFNLVENRRDGGLHIGELVVALQSGAPGLQVPLPAGQRDAKARQQVRGQLAPFHRSALEVRLQVRQKLSGEADAKEAQASKWSFGESKTFAQRLSNSSSAPNLLGGYTQQAPPALLPEVPAARGSPVKSRPQPMDWPGSPVKRSPGMGLLQPLSPASPSSPSPWADVAAPRTFLSRSGSTGCMAHQPTRRSHKKVTHLLQSRPPSVFNRSNDDKDPILDRIHDYYVSAGDTMANDMHLLKSPPLSLKARQPISLPAARG